MVKNGRMEQIFIEGGFHVSWTTCTVGNLDKCFRLGDVSTVSRGRKKRTTMEEIVTKNGHVLCLTSLWSWIGLLALGQCVQRAVDGDRRPLAAC